MQTCLPRIWIMRKWLEKYLISTCGYQITAAPFAPLFALFLWNPIAHTYYANYYCCCRHTWGPKIKAVEIYDPDLHHLVLNYFIINGLAGPAEIFMNEAGIERKPQLRDT